MLCYLDASIARMAGMPKRVCVVCNQLKQRGGLGPGRSAADTMALSLMMSVQSGLA